MTPAQANVRYAATSWMPPTAASNRASAASSSAHGAGITVRARPPVRPARCCSFFCCHLLTAKLRFAAAVMELAARDSMPGRCPHCRTEYSVKEIKFSAPPPEECVPCLLHGPARWHAEAGYLTSAGCPNHGRPFRAAGWRSSIESARRR